MPDPVRLSVPVRQLDPGLPLPSYARPGDAGLDLYAAAHVQLKPGARALVGTGLAVAIPRGYVGLVAPRSGLAARHGISIVNAPGVIDSGYRGEIMVNLQNTDRVDPFVIQREDRIAQLLIVPVAVAELVPVDELDATDRGNAGHGASGGFGVSAAGASGA